MKVMSMRREKRELYPRRPNLRHNIPVLRPPHIRKKAPPPHIQKKVHIQIRPPPVAIPRLQPRLKNQNQLRIPKSASTQKLVVPSVPAAQKLVPPISKEQDIFIRRKRPRSPSPDDLYQPQQMYKKRRTRRHVDVGLKAPRTTKTPSKRVKPIRQSKVRPHTLKRPVFNLDGQPEDLLIVNFSCYTNQALCWRQNRIVVPDLSEITMEDWPSSDEELCQEGREDTSDRAYFLRHFRAEKREKLFYMHLQKWRQQEKEQAARDQIENSDELRVMERPKGPWQYKLKEKFDHIRVPDSIDTRNLRFNYKFTRPWKQPAHYIKLVSTESLTQAPKMVTSKTEPVKNSRGGKDLSDYFAKKS